MIFDLLSVAEPALCEQGGLQAVNENLLLEETLAHVRQCPACQRELTASGGMAPARPMALLALADSRDHG